MEAVRPIDTEAALEERLLAPLRCVGTGFWMLVAVLVMIIALGVFAYALQIQEGLIVTGLRDRIFWGLYVAVFEFFLGVSMAGTFVSAVLRLTGAGWRGPVTRVGEIMAFAALSTAFLFILMDIGRPDRMYNFILYGRWESPLVWDVFGISTYLAGSWIYFYFGLIPDIALTRDRLGDAISVPRRLFFRFTAIGWTGNRKQFRSWAAALGLMAVAIVPVAVMMNAVASWIFSMTLREPWSNPMFGLYFVGGAALSGVGLIVIFLVVLRKVYKLEDYITRDHFVRLGYILAVFAAFMAFFNVSDFVMAGYKLAGEAPFNLHQMVEAGIAPLFWIYMWGGVIFPILIVLIPKTRNIAGIVVAAIAANIGMFMERFVVVMGGLRVPLNPYNPASYSPSGIEWMLTAAGFAVFLLIIVVLLKLFPPLSIWEMKQLQAERAHPAEKAGEAAEQQQFEATMS